VIQTFRLQERKKITSVKSNDAVAASAGHLGGLPRRLRHWKVKMLAAWQGSGPPLRPKLGRSGAHTIATIATPSGGSRNRSTTRREKHSFISGEHLS